MAAKKWLQIEFKFKGVGRKNSMGMRPTEKRPKKQNKNKI